MLRRRRSSRFKTRVPIVLLAISLLVLNAFSGAAQTSPLPIDPDTGEQNLLDLINSLPLNDIQNALDRFPVPYVVVAQADGNDPVIANNRAGAPTRVDADSSTSTGQGNSGHDLIVEVNTVLLPSPHLEMSIQRLGNAPYAQDLTILIAFPFDAFNAEALPGAPNLFIGYQTTGADGSPGGHAPQSEIIRFIPDVLAGTSHLFELEMETVNAANPLRFIAGHFDGTNVTGVLNASAMSAYVDPVPSTISLGLDVNENALADPEILSEFALDWTASAPATVVFDYLESESAPSGVPDYNTVVTFDQMPTSESLGLSLSEGTPSTLTISHRGNAQVDTLTVLHERNDGMVVEVEASEVPTEVDLTIDLAGAAELDVNANTMDILVTATHEDGFASTSGFLGYPLGFAQLQIIDAPDLSAWYDAATDSFSIMATNPGESIPMVSFIIGDDDQLELPPGAPGAWDDLTQHVFSLMDDGIQGTAAARIVHVVEATLMLDATSIGEAYTLTTGTAAPLTAYLRTEPTSNLIAGHDVEVHCLIQDVPAGTLNFEIDFPISFSYTTDPPTGIDSVECSGFIDTLNFDLGFGGLPAIFAYEFDPDSHLTITAEDGSGPNSAVLGFVRVRLWDNDLNGLPGSGGLFGIALNDARIRADQIPSFHSTWSDGAGATAINFDTDANDAFLGGAQLAVSTIVELNDPLPVADGSSEHYLLFEDDGAGQRKLLTAGAFGIDAFSFASNDVNLDLHYDADSARALEATIDSRFGGRFFPDVDIAGTLRIDQVPQMIDFSTDMKTFLDYAASSGISSISVDAEVDTTNDSVANGTHIDALIQGIPSEMHVDMDPSDGHAHLHANAQINSVHVELTSDAAIFGTDYKWALLDITTIAARFDIDWTFDEVAGTASVSAVATDAAMNPAALGSLDRFVLSRETKDDSADNLNPFTSISGGMVSRSAFQTEIDNRYFPNSVETRLNDLYSSNVVLDGTPLEDHVIIRKPSDLEYVDVQFGGFQSFTAAVSPAGGTATLAIPTPGAHPLFIGLEGASSKFTLVQVEDVPDTMSVDVNLTDHVIFNSSSSAGRIDFYTGPLPMAGEGVQATRATLFNTPSQVALNFGNLASFPGGASFTASNQFELLLLHQSGSNRVVAGLQMEDVSVSWGTDQFYTDCDEVLEVPTCFGLFKVFANLDAVGDVSGQGASGFVMSYQLIGNPQNLSGGVAPNGNEYVPRLSFLLRDFQDFGVDFEIQLDPLNPFSSELYPIDFEFNIDGPNYGAGGGLNFDFWDLGFSACFDPGTGDVCIVDNPPDYIDNNPWHVVPVFHSAGSHVDPFVP